MQGFRMCEVAKNHQETFSTHAGMGLRIHWAVPCILYDYAHDLIPNTWSNSWLRRFSNGQDPSRGVRTPTRWYCWAGLQ